MKVGYYSTDQIVGVVANHPSQALYPFALFEILIMAEEVLDLIAHYGWEISVVFNQVVVWIEVIDWNREDLFVETMFILHQQSDWATSDNRARGNRNLREGQCIAWVAIFRETSKRGGSLFTGWEPRDRIRRLQCRRDKRN
jgi:hypothetical protein